MKNALFIAAVFSAAISDVAATVYIGHNFFTGQWSATLNEQGPCKGRNNVADFTNLFEGGNRNPGNPLGSQSPGTITNPCGHTFTAPNGFQYNMAFCGTADIALFNGGDTSSFNHKCERFTKDIGCGWTHQWKC